MCKNVTQVNKEPFAERDWKENRTKTRWQSQHMIQVENDKNMSTILKYHKGTLHYISMLQLHIAYKACSIRNIIIMFEFEWFTKYLVICYFGITKGGD